MPTQGVLFEEKWTPPTPPEKNKQTKNNNENTVQNCILKTEWHYK